MAYNKEQVLRDNIEAIRTVLSGENDKEKAAKYKGFGGLKSVIYDPYKPELYPISEQNLIPLYRELHDMLKGYAESDEQYKKMYDSIKSSTMTAFYTPTEIIDAIGGALQESGIQIDRMLDPSCGTGRFLAIPAAHQTAFEKDYLTARILAAIHPEIDVHAKGFEYISQKLEGTFDCAISNIPFGQIPVCDPRLSSKGYVAKKSCGMIHNYFFMKAADMVKQDGGFVSFITSTGTADSKENKEIRKELLKSSRLVSAYRLPENTFPDSGTKVQSDIIILQKDPNRPPLTEEEQRFIDGVYFQDKTKIIHTESKIGTDQFGKEAVYYRHSGGVEGIAKELGEKLAEDLRERFDLTLYAGKEQKQETAAEVKPGEIGVVIPSKTTQEHYVKPIGFGSSEIKDMELPALAKMGVREEHPEHGEVFKFPNKEQAEKFNESAQAEIIEASEDIASIGKEVSLDSLFDDVPTPTFRPEPFIYQKDMYHTPQEGEYILSPDGAPAIVKSAELMRAETVSLTDAERPAMEAYIRLKTAYYELYGYEEHHKYADGNRREELNQAYDEFLRQYGPLHKIDQTPYKIIAEDANYKLIRGLENINGKDITKAEIFYNPISFNEVIYTIEDAYLKSLDAYNKVDLDYIAQISGTTVENVRTRLEQKDMILFDPVQNEWQGRSHLLSGDIAQKIDAFTQAANGNPAAEKSIEALKEVMPERVKFEDIGISFGERWIPNEYYERFAQQLFENPTIAVRYNADTDNMTIVDRYNSRTLGYFAEQQYGITAQYARNQSAGKVFESAFYNHVPEMSYTDIDGYKRIDTEALKAYDVKVEKIRTAFVEYLSNLPKQEQDKLEEQYNRIYNSEVKESLDGSFQSFPDLNLANLGYSEVRKSQADAVLMIKNNGGGIIDHEVGNGKTLTLCMAAYEMKRIGKIQKPIIIGLKANLSAIVEEYRKAYPNAKILYPSAKEIAGDKVDIFLNKIRNNNWDAIFMTHDQFMKIPQSPEIEQKLIQEELDKLEKTTLDIINDDSVDSASQRKMLKNLEKSKVSLEARMETLTNTIAKRKSENTINFKDMGIDHIFVDESHRFKNLRFYTKHTNVKGLGNAEGSDRAYNMLLAIRTIQDRTGKDLGATFASGTTITNSMSEMYTLFNYLRPKMMREKNMQNFDAWASMFMVKSADYEFNVVNNLNKTERFRNFQKVPELSAMYNQITDYKTSADAKIEKPGMNRILVNIPPTPDQEIYFERLKEFVKRGDNEAGTLIGLGVLTDEQVKAKMLTATNAALKGAMDMRLIDPRFADDPNSKVNVAMNKVKEYYDKFDADKGTQLIFCDTSTYKNEKEWSLYNDMRDKLIAKGIPANEIAIIHQYDSDKAKEKLFAKVNAGEVRVVIGSTEKLGTGVNVQERCIAMHHMDVPWRSSDIEQRNGRGSRQGNKLAPKANGNKVDTLFYCTERSLDNYKLSCADRKLQFIQQLKSSNLNTRTIDEGGMDENTGASFQEYIAILSGDTSVLEKAKAEQRIQQLESMRNTYVKDYRHAKSSFEESFAHVEKTKRNIQRITADNAAYSKIKTNEKGLPDPYKMTINGVEYTDPKKAGEALLREAEKQEPEAGIKPIGEFCGFKINKRTTQVTDPNLFKNMMVSTVEVRGTAAYQFNNGEVSATSAAYYPFKALSRIPKVLKTQEMLLESYQSTYDKHKRTVERGISFPHQQELDELKAKLHDLNEKIDKGIADNKRMEQSDERLKIGSLPYDNDQNVLDVVWEKEARENDVKMSLPDKYDIKDVEELSYQLGVSKLKMCEELSVKAWDDDQKTKAIVSLVDNDLAKDYLDNKYGRSHIGIDLQQSIKNEVAYFVQNGKIWVEQHNDMENSIFSKSADKPKSQDQGMGM